MWANATWLAPWPTTREIVVDESSIQPSSFFNQSVALTPVASLEPKLSILPVIRNCSLGLGIDGSVLTAPSLKARSIPCGLCSTGKIIDISLSDSLFS